MRQEWRERIARWDGSETTVVGPASGAGVRAFDTMAYTDEEIRRVVRLAFRLAEGRSRHVTSIDKANVLETSRLWRQTVLEVAKDFQNFLTRRHHRRGLTSKLDATPSSRSQSSTF